jgi:hypothetical protein
MATANAETLEILKNMNLELKALKDKLNNDVLSIRSDIKELVEYNKNNTATIVAAYHDTVVSQTAAFESLSDRLVAVAVKTATVNSTSKRPVKTDSIKTGSVAVTTKSKKSPVNVDLHCNFPKIPTTAWDSTKVYTPQMYKSYPEHMRHILGDEIMDTVINHEDMKSLPGSASPHARSTMFKRVILKLPKDVSDNAMSLIDADRINQNNIRIKGSFNHVGPEGITPEEDAAIASTPTN